MQVMNGYISRSRDFKQIAINNSFLQKPITLDYLRLSLRERAEIIIDLQDSLSGVTNKIQFVLLARMEALYINSENMKLLVKMTDFTNEKIPYMYHCHFLEHEDAGMMGQFIVRRI